jgi:peptide/nickel transport system substrate-binding protein
MNLAKGVTQELAVRQAIAHAVDASAIVSEFLEGHGAVSRGGAREGWPRYNEEIPLDEYDPELAGQILDEAGWTLGGDGVRERDGERLKVNVLSTQLERALSYGLMNQVIQESLESVGFETEIQTMEWGAYLDEFRAGEWWEVTWHAQNADAYENAGATLDPDGYWNVNQHAKATDPELVELADQIREIYAAIEKEVDPQERITLWAEAQKLCYDYKLVAWLVHWDYLVAVQSEVKDLIIKPTIQDTLYKVHLAWLES